MEGGRNLTNTAPARWLTSVRRPVENMYPWCDENGTHLCGLPLQNPSPPSNSKENFRKILLKELSTKHPSVSLEIVTAILLLCRRHWLKFSILFSLASETEVLHMAVVWVVPVLGSSFYCKDTGAAKSHFGVFTLVYWCCDHQPVGTSLNIEEISSFQGLSLRFDQVWIYLERLICT